MILHKTVAPIHPLSPKKTPNQRLCDQLNNTTGLLDLLLGVGAEVAGTDDDGDLGETALAEDLGVTEGQEVDDGSGVGLGAAQVGIALLGGDKGPELYHKKKSQSANKIPIYCDFPQLGLRRIVCFHFRGRPSSTHTDTDTHPASLASLRVDRIVSK